jgi:NADPH2:quinone reductase
MQAVVVSERGGPDTLQLARVPDPEPKIISSGPEGEVVVDIAAVGVNFADTMQTQGTYPGGPRPPFTPGLEFAGRIHDSDERVMGFSTGAYAERIVIPRGRLFPIPQDWSFAEAAAFPVNYFTAYFAYWMLGFHRLETTSVDRSVLIHAVAGGVGTAAVQIGRILSITTYGTSSSDEKLAHCRTLGLNYGINYRKVDYEQEIARLTDGRGVHAVFEMLGGDHTAKSTRCLAEFGKMIVYGNATGAPPQFDFISMLQRNAEVQALWITPMLAHKVLIDEAFDQLMMWSKPQPGLGLRPVVGAEFPLDQAADAHRMLLERRNFGKVVLRVP